MGQDYFQFKQFTIKQDRSAMKVTTDSCLFGAWIKFDFAGSPTVLDIGTGTGLLSLFVAQNHPSAVIDAIEVDEDACQQAAENFEESPWRDRLHAIPGDIKTFSIARKYDVIISNPPFYEKEIRSDDRGRNIAHHSEVLLLSELLLVIKENLDADGSFFLLLPFKRNEEIRKLFLANSFHIEKMVFVKQTVRHPYFRIMVRGKISKKGETEIDEIAIKDENDNYTDKFVNLVRPFYLYL